MPPQLAANNSSILLFVLRKGRVSIDLRFINAPLSDALLPKRREMTFQKGLTVNRHRFDLFAHQVFGMTI
jgi:hypothetical protein